MPAGRAAGLLAALAAALAAPAAAQEPPPALMEDVEIAFGQCRSQGGAAEIMEGYQTRADLNGDGVTDFVTDLAGIDCTGAPDALCAPTGCPVTAWLSEPDGAHARFELGFLRSFELAPADGGGLPVLRAEYHPAHCGDTGGGAGCTRSWTFDSNAPAVPAPDAPPAPPEAEVVAEAEAEPEPAPEPGGPTLPADASRPATDLPEGWTLRQVPDGSTLALGRGTGRVASLAAFCLAGVPFLALHMSDDPGAETVTLFFAFSQGEVEAEARREETAGGAYVLGLGDGPLAERLAGRDSRVQLGVDGVDEGILSLSGSTRSLTTALADCHEF